MLKIVFFVFFITATILYMMKESSAMQKNGIQCGCRYPRILKPVCGDDHVTYDNRGVIRCLNKCNNTDIKVLHRGPCHGDEPLYL